MEEITENNFNTIKEDDVNHPSHYIGNIECIDAMISTFGKENVKLFCKLNAFKYLWRAGKKSNNSEEKDVSKAKWYIDKYLKLCEIEKFS